MTDRTIELHNNTTNCLHSVASWGYTTYVNVCTGEEVGVGWGNMDYMFAVFCAIILACILIFCLGAITLFIMENLFNERSN